MKRITLLSLVLFTITLGCSAQNNIIDLTQTANVQLDWSSGNSYYKDINNLIAPYIGTWKWAEGNRELTLTLIKQTKYHYHKRGFNNYYEDKIVGYYIYKENSVVLIDTSNDNFETDFGMSVHFTLTPNTQISSISFDDMPKHKDYDVWLELTSPTTLKFHGKEEENLVRVKEGQAPPVIYQGTSFPLEMTLVKQ